MPDLVSSDVISEVDCIHHRNPLVHGWEFMEPYLCYIIVAMEMTFNKKWTTSLSAISVPGITDFGCFVQELFYG